MGTPLAGGAFGPSALGPTGLDTTLGGTTAADAETFVAGARAARPPLATTRDCERATRLALAADRAARGALATTIGVVGGAATGTNVEVTGGAVGATSGDSPSTRSAGRARCAGRLRRDGVAERVVLGTDGGGGGGARAGGGTTTGFTVHKVLLAAASGGGATISVARVAGGVAGATAEACVDEAEQSAGTAEDGAGADFNAGAGTQGRGKEEAGAAAGVDKEEDEEHAGETDDSKSGNATGKRPRVLGGVRGSPVAPLNVGGGVAVQREGTHPSVTPPRGGLERMPDAKWARMRDGVNSIGVAMAPLPAARSLRVGEKAFPEQPRERGKRGRGSPREREKRGTGTAESDENKKISRENTTGCSKDGEQHRGGGQGRRGTSNRDGGETAGRWGREPKADDAGNSGRGRAREHGCTSATTANARRTHTPPPQAQRARWSAG